MIFKIIGGKAVRYDSGGTDKIDDSTVDFSQAETRENIAPTDTMKIILGKIMKWFSDLSAGAASSLLGQNLTAGKVLVSDDGGKVAASVVDASKVGFLSGVTSDVQGQINSLNSAIVIQYEHFPDSTYIKVRQGYKITVVTLGKLCWLTGQVVALQTWQGSGKGVGIVLPKPLEETVSGAYGFLNDDIVARFIITTSGDLRFQNGIANRTYGMSVMYVMAVE